MLDVQLEGKRAIIDVRELIKNGGHPRFKIFDYVKDATVGTVFEIHVPRRPVPLIKGLEDMGLNVAVEEIEANHFRLVTVKIGS